MNRMPKNSWKFWQIYTIKFTVFNVHGLHADIFRINGRSGVVKEETEAVNIIHAVSEEIDDLYWKMNGLLQHFTVESQGELVDTCRNALEDSRFSIGKLFDTWQELSTKIEDMGYKA